MTKDAERRSKGLEILDKLTSSIPKERKQRTVNLNDFMYLSFLKVSLQKEVAVSRLLEEVLSSFLDDVEPKWRSQDPKKLAEFIEKSKAEPAKKADK